MKNLVLIESWTGTKWCRVGLVNEDIAEAYMLRLRQRWYTLRSTLLVPATRFTEPQEPGSPATP